MLSSTWWVVFMFHFLKSRRTQTYFWLLLNETSSHINSSGSLTGKKSYQEYHSGSGSHCQSKEGCGFHSASAGDSLSWSVHAFLPCGHSSCKQHHKDAKKCGVNCKLMIEHVFCVRCDANFPRSWWKWNYPKWPNSLEWSLIDE